MKTDDILEKFSEMMNAEVSVSNRDYKLIMKPCMKGHFHVLNDTHVFGMRNLSVRCDEYFAAYCKNHIEDGVYFRITDK